MRHFCHGKKPLLLHFHSLLGVVWNPNHTIRQHIIFKLFTGMTPYPLLEELPALSEAYTGFQQFLYQQQDVFSEVGRYSMLSTSWELHLKTTEWAGAISLFHVTFLLCLSLIKGKKKRKEIALHVKCKQ